MPPANQPSLDIGDSFTLQTPSGIHLHVIVAETSPGSSDSIMLVYLSSVNSQYMDTTTVIEVGEHPFVSRRSWVRYQNILIVSRSEVQNMIVQYYGKISPELLGRIQAGIEASDYSPNRDKELFHEWKMDGLYRDLQKN